MSHFGDVLVSHAGCYSAFTYTVPDNGLVSLGLPQRYRFRTRASLRPVQEPAWPGGALSLSLSPLATKESVLPTWCCLKAERIACCSSSLLGNWAASGRLSAWVSYALPACTCLPLLGAPAYRWLLVHLPGLSVGIRPCYSSTFTSAFSGLDAGRFSRLVRG